MSTVPKHRKLQRGRRSAPSSPALIPMPLSPALKARRRSASRPIYRRRRSSSSVRSVHLDPLPLPASASSSSSSFFLDESPFDASDINSIKATLDNTLPVDYFKQDLLSIAIALNIPKWRKIASDSASLEKLHLVRLSGALTNCIYKVTYGNFYPLLLRIYGSNAGELIDREKELQILARLSRQNIGPKLLGCFTNGRFEEFLNNSITLTKDQIRDRRVSRMIARRMKQLHYGVPLLPDETSQGPKVWYLIEKWVGLVDKIMTKCNTENQKEFLIVDWPKFKQLIFKYKEWLWSRYGGNAGLNSHLRFCHNDTQYGNLLFYNKYDRLPMDEDDDDDGSLQNGSIIEPEQLPITSDVRKSHDPSISSPKKVDSVEDNLAKRASKLSIGSQTSEVVPLVTDLNFQYDKSLVVIDFEYSGANIPAYDITNHFCEWMYDYTDPEFSYRTNDDKYPTREEIINFLNSYVKYVPGSVTPAGYLNKSASSVGIGAKSSSVVNLKEDRLPPKVVTLYNETIMWRSASAIFWAIWGIINGGSSFDTPLKKTHTYTELGPRGEKYTITVEPHSAASSLSTSPSSQSSLTDESVQASLTDNADDQFDHLKYVLGKCGVIIGDFIQFGLIKVADIDPSMRMHIKYLDTEFLRSKH